MAKGSFFSCGLLKLKGKGYWHCAYRKDAQFIITSLLNFRRKNQNDLSFDPCLKESPIFHHYSTFNKLYRPIVMED